MSPVDEGPAEPCTILDGLGLRLGLAKMLQHPFGLAERDVRLANLEPEVDGPLGNLARGGQAAERLERLLEARQRFSVRRARRRGRPGLDQVTGRAIPRVAGVVMTPEGQRMRGEIRVVQRFHRPRGGLVQALAVRRQQAITGDRPRLLVREVEAFAHDVQDAARDQLFDAFGGLRGAQPGRALQQREVAFATDDARHGGQKPSPIAEPIQPSRDDLADARGREDFRRQIVRLAFPKREHRLADHEWVALARPPDPFPEPMHERLLCLRADQRSHQRVRLDFGQRPQGQGEEARLTAELGDRPSQHRRIRHLLHAQRSDDEDRQLDDPPRQEHEQSEAHLVRPVEIFEHDE